MKQLFSVIFLAISFQCVAQDPILYDHTWYLHDLIIDGASIPPVNLKDAEFIDLVFDENLPIDYNFETYICGSASGEVHFDDPNSTFSFFGGIDIFGCCCLSQATEDYAALYYSYFLDEVDFPFVYSISSSGVGITLQITSQSGNQAIYGNQVLGVDDTRFLDIALYPNPVYDKLIISPPSTKVLSVHIYSMEGKVVSSFEEEQLAGNEIGLSHLQSGVYFLRIQTESGHVIKKFIKD